MNTSNQEHLFIPYSPIETLHLILECPHLSSFETSRRSFHKIFIHEQLINLGSNSQGELREEKKSKMSKSKNVIPVCLSSFLSRAEARTSTKNGGHAL